MRNVFLVAAKLLGVYSIYRALSALVALGYIPGSMSQPGFNIAAYLGVRFLSALIFFMFGYILAFRTSWVADIVHVAASDDDLPTFTDRSALNVGVILVGVFNVVARFPNLLIMISMYDSRQPLSWLLLPAGEVVGLILGVFLIFYSRTVVDVICRGNKRAED